jgi:hypothetical protein
MARARRKAKPATSHVVLDALEAVGLIGLWRDRGGVVEGFSYAGLPKPQHSERFYRYLP